MAETYRMTVHIESVIGPPSDEDRFTSTAPARLEISGDRRTLTFCEGDESGKTYTTFAFRQGERRVEMRSRGNVTNEICFDPSEAFTTVYHAAPLTFDLTVRSQEVLASLDKNGGEIRLVYTRWLGGYVSHVRYLLRAVPEGSSL